MEAKKVRIEKDVQSENKGQPYKKGRSVSLEKLIFLRQEGKTS